MHGLWYIFNTVAFIYCEISYDVGSYFPPDRSDGFAGFCFPTIFYFSYVQEHPVISKSKVRGCVTGLQNREKPTQFSGRKQG